MNNTNLTRVAIVVDRSDSMRNLSNSANRKLVRGTKVLVIK